MRSTSDELKIHPNPSNDILFVSGVGLMVITDSVGKKVLSQQLNSPTNKIDLSNFAKGTYMISLNGGSAVFIKN